MTLVPALRKTRALSIAALALLPSLGCSDEHALIPPKPTDLSVFDLDRPEPAASNVAAPTRKPPPAVVARDASPPLAGEPSASSTYSGWPMTNALDGDEKTSWYSGQDDSVAKGKSPFFQLTFPEPRSLRRVSVLGNRDPAYFDGFGILRAQLDVFDASGRLLVTLRADGHGDRNDYTFDLSGIEGAKIIRFTSLGDEGKRNQWGDIAIAELSVE